MITKHLATARDRWRLNAVIPKSGALTNRLSCFANAFLGLGYSPRLIELALALATEGTVRCVYEDSRRRRWPRCSAGDDVDFGFGQGVADHADRDTAGKPYPG
jgi:hypothetical protein